MNKFKLISILFLLCIIEVGFLVSFSKYDFFNKIFSIPIILIIGFIIFYIIKNYEK